MKGWLKLKKSHESADVSWMSRMISCERKRSKAQALWVLGALLCLSACDILARRETNHDPKPDMSAEREAAEKEQVPPMSAIGSVIEVESSTVGVGEQIGVTLTVKNTKGQIMTAATGATVNFVLLGESLGTFSAVTDNGDGTFYAELTGMVVGDPSKVVAQVDGTTLYSTPEVAVVAGPAAKVVIETAIDGSGSAVSNTTLANGASLPLYAVARDAGNNYVGGATVSWSESNGMGVFSTLTGVSTLYKPHKGAGTTVITADHATLVDDVTGTITMTWSVSDISNLVLWLKADAMMSLANNDSVSAWTDVSVGGHSAIQVTSSEQPTFKSTGGPNSQPTIVFDGSDDKMTIPHHTDFNTNTMSVFAVAKNVSAKSYSMIIAKTTSSAWNDGWGFGDIGGTGSNFGLFVNDDSANTALGTFSVGSYKYLSAVYDQSTLKFWVNGTQSGSDTYSSVINPSAADLYIGDFLGNSGCSSGCLNGEIAEIILYGTGLNTSQRQSVESYLATKYGL